MAKLIVWSIVSVDGYFERGIAEYMHAVRELVASEALTTES